MKAHLVKCMATLKGCSYWDPFERFKTSFVVVGTGTKSRRKEDVLRTSHVIGSLEDVYIENVLSTPRQETC